MRAKLAKQNGSAVPFLSRATVNLCWFNYITAQPKRIPAQNVTEAMSGFIIREPRRSFKARTFICNHQKLPTTGYSRYRVYA